jgi:Domain of unknown function (DUF4331)
MLIAGSTLAATALALLPGTASASSHREAPLIAADPYVDNTDVYAFVSPDKPDTVTLIANWFGLQEPNGGPTFYPWATDAHYDINIDSDGDALPDTTYRYEFFTDNKAQKDTFLYANGPVTSLDDKNLLFKQYWRLTKIHKGKSELIGKGQAAPSNAGAASIPDYAPLRKQATYPVGKGAQTYVGQSEDPFFLDLRVFDLLYGGNLSETGQDTLAGFNVNAIALQVPISDIALNYDGKKNPVIGVWSDTERRSLKLSPGAAKPNGDFVQVSRLGNPLVNEVVLPVSLKDAFNGLTPDKDATIPAVVKRVTSPEVPKLIQAIYGIPAPAEPRNDLVEIFLTGIAKKAPTLDGKPAPIQADLNSQVLNKDANPKKFQPSEMLRLNTAVPPAAKPNRLGVLAGDFQGFPNGRRLADDVVDITVQAAEGAAQSGKIVQALAAGDGVNANDKKFGDKFPYIALPNNNSVNTKANTQGSSAVPFVPGGTGTGLPTPSVLTGFIAALLLGAGGVLVARRRPKAVPAGA